MPRRAPGRLKWCILFPVVQTPTVNDDADDRVGKYIGRFYGVWLISCCEALTKLGFNFMIGRHVFFYPLILNVDVVDDLDLHANHEDELLMPQLNVVVDALNQGALAIPLMHHLDVVDDVLNLDALTIVSDDQLN
ncbi:hypothetical protein DM860_001180 [Cuscuta australis]|uniref:Uncharacterized protein n=1 Tax=Cuscuta australis TaxID=267555 RepID=A0A328DU88_9ASTE|nr:hypothetical protein DM860_001180 [Cuscuta australis]